MLDAGRDDFDSGGIVDGVLGRLPDGLFLVEQRDLALQLVGAVGEQLALVGGEAAERSPVDDLFAQLHDVGSAIEKAVDLSRSFGDLRRLAGDGWIWLGFLGLGGEASGYLLEFEIQSFGLIGDLWQWDGLRRGRRCRGGGGRGGRLRGRRCGLRLAGKLDLRGGGNEAARDATTSRNAAANARVRGAGRRETPDCGVGWLASSQRETFPFDPFHLND